MGRTESWPENDYERAYGWKGNTFNESEMALFFECMLQCARKVLDSADIVRDAMLRQLWQFPIVRLRQPAYSVG